MKCCAPSHFDAHEKIKKMASGIAESMGGSCDVEVKVGYPFLKNTPELAEKIIAFIK